MSGAAATSPIVETVTTTINPDGTVNCAAMGVEWEDKIIVIKPYRGTRTLRNLRATGAAVVNLTDDILLFTQAALARPCRLVDQDLEACQLGADLLRRQPAGA